MAGDSENRIPVQSVSDEGKICTVYMLEMSMYPFLEQSIRFFILHIGIGCIVQIHFFQGVDICKSIHFRIAAVQGLKNLVHLRK